MRNITIILLVLFLTSCANTARIALEATYIDTLVASGAPQEDIRTNPNLTDTQLLQVTHAFNEYNALRTKWEHAVKDSSGTQLILIDDMFLADYDKIKKQYLTVERIVAEHWETYDRLSQMQLMSAMVHAHNLDSAINKAVAARDKYQSARNLLDLGLVLLQIGTRL